MKVYDPVSPPGHSSFNTKIINELGGRISTIYVLQRAINSELDSRRTRSALYSSVGSKIFSVFRHMHALINPFDSEKRLVLAFENRFIFLFLLGLSRKSNLYLVFHNNMTGYLSCGLILRFIYRRCLKKTNAIFLTDSARSVFSNVDFDSVLVTSIPIVSRSKKDCTSVNRQIIWLAKAYLDDVFIKELYNNDVFNELISKNDLTFVLRQMPCFNVEKKNWVVIAERLDNADYDTMVSKSWLCVVHYNNRYRFRASSILTDCLELGANVIANRSVELLGYSDCVPQERFFSSVEEFIDLVEKNLSMQIQPISIDCISKNNVIRKKLLSKYLLR